MPLTFIHVKCMLLEARFFKPLRTLRSFFAPWASLRMTSLLQRVSAAANTVRWCREDPIARPVHLPLDNSWVYGNTSHNSDVQIRRCGPRSRSPVATQTTDHVEGTKTKPPQRRNHDGIFKHSEKSTNDSFVSILHSPLIRHHLVISSCLP